MKIPLFSKLTAKSRGRKVVRASARAMRGGEDDYYEAEPNMKLSHAFMVVLILHVVAVGGIYAFNHIKVNKKSDLLANISGKISQATGGALPSAALATAAATAPAEPQRQPGDADDPLPLMAEAPAAPVAAATTAAAQPAVVTSKPPAAPAPTAPKVTQSSPPKAAVASTAATAPAPAGAAPGTYKVAKGDNPYTIAKKLGVSSQDLLQVNGIEDPTKLQIGQVLKVPGKSN
jgi:LysM repeat protein